MRSRAVVVSVGARTPLGLDAITTGFAHRAANVVMTQSALLDHHDEPATMCLLPTIDPFVTGAERAVLLARPALEEALVPLTPLLPQLRYRLVLCFDEYFGARQDNGSPPSHYVSNTLSRRAAALAPHLDDVFSLARGPASLGYALERIEADLDTFDAVIVGGIHTDYDLGRIRALSLANRLLSADKLDAMIPGECAAFNVFMRADKAAHYRLKPQAELNDHATAIEPARPDNDESAFEASALTAAIRQIGATLEANDRQAGWLLTDLHFETMRHYEFQAVMARTIKYWCDPQQCDCPAQRMGYLGAAAIPLHIALAAEGWRRGWAPHQVAVSFAGSDAGERAVAVLSAPS